MTRFVRFFTWLFFCASVASAASLTYTCDPSVDATDAGTCAYLNSTISNLYTGTLTNVSANIYIEQGIAGLAANETAESFVPFSAYLNALTATGSGNGVDTAALAALNTLDAAVYGADNVVVTSALAGALGFTGVGGITASGANCTIGVSAGCYNGVITVTSPSNLASLYPGQSLYYPRVMMRTLAQVLTEEYSEFGVHVANIVIDGTIDSPGTRAMPRNQNRPDLIINPVKIAEAFWYLHTQDKSCWTHELQLTPFPTKPSY